MKSCCCFDDEVAVHLCRLLQLQLQSLFIWSSYLTVRSPLTLYFPLMTTVLFPGRLSPVRLQQNRASYSVNPQHLFRFTSSSSRGRAVHAIRPVDPRSARTLRQSRVPRDARAISDLGVVTRQAQMHRPCRRYLKRRGTKRTTL